MDVHLSISFEANQTHYQFKCETSEDPNLRSGDYVEIVDGMFPLRVEDVTYIADTDEKIYTIQHPGGFGEIDGEDLLDEVKDCPRWSMTLGQ